MISSRLSNLTGIPVGYNREGADSQSGYKGLRSYIQRGLWLVFCFSVRFSRFFFFLGLLDFGGVFLFLVGFIILWCVYVWGLNFY